MDCVIPGHCIRQFCAAIGCLSRVGKDLYVDFDPIDGLWIRALNDAKSVCGSFHYEPGFFLHCGAASTLNKKKKRGNKKKRKGEKRKQPTAAEREEQNNPTDDRWTACVAMKALSGVVRARKDVVNLHVKTMGDHLAFTYLVEKPGDGHSTPTVYVKVMHKVGYSPAKGVTAVASTDGSSEVVVQPSVFSTMLEPLKRASEIALLVNDNDRMISGVTFQHGDLPENMTSGLSRAAKSSKLKTETSVAYDELIDVHYVGHADDDVVVTGNNIVSKGIPPPENMKDHMVLVITYKEFKAFLQYCSHAILDQELQLSMSFFWGGKPMVMKTMGEHFEGEMIMATLDHQLLRNSLHFSLSSATKGAVGGAAGAQTATGGEEKQEA